MPRLPGELVQQNGILLCRAIVRQNIYYLVWVTKYHHPLLCSDVGNRCRELLRETAWAHKIAVHAGLINRDHLQMLV